MADCEWINDIGNGIRINGSADGVKTPFLIGVAGGTASGKWLPKISTAKYMYQQLIKHMHSRPNGTTFLHHCVPQSTVCKRIMEQLGQADMDHTQRQVVTISQDSFYRELTTAEKARAERGLFNFDHPSAFNEDLMLQTLQDILHGKKVEISEYDYRMNAVCPEKIITIYPADVVLFEGILVFYFPAIRDLFHMKLFVDTDSDTRLARRVPRDINERGRDLDQVLNAYMNFVKPAFEEFCSPTKKFADVVIPRGADNTVAIDLIVQHIREFLNNRTRSDHSPYLATCETSALNLAGGRGKPSFSDSDTHYRPH